MSGWLDGLYLLTNLELLFEHAHLILIDELIQLLLDDLFYLFFLT
jgi:hypothetical protein